MEEAQGEEEEEEEEEERKESEEENETSLPIPNQRLPRPRQDRDSEGSEGDRGAETAPFSFLMSLDADPAESESGASLSEASVSGASVSGLSLTEASALTGWHTLATPAQPRSPPLPGPWLKPSPQKLSQVFEGNGLKGRGGGL
ncbi:general transcription factor IIF subunit 1-like [Megalops cyprinoides]|uniref:general transcription factor IIF subunit 1-like n=1 Tax=Megalops cyprinoides TaxID=118141 RepID=UPI0018645B20|nr:general transcription factor IIF subunit 1-like [Megalops cyprinoides]